MNRGFEGDANPYRPPSVLADAGRDADERRDSGRSAAFHAVSTRKLVVLYLATMGLYSVYWFYLQWRQQKLAHGLSIWPGPRAVFSIFFVSALFKSMDQAAREAGEEPAWSPGNSAAMFIGLVVVSRVISNLGRLEIGMGVTALSTVLALLAVVPLERAQRVANTALGDPSGQRNAAFGAGAIVAMSLGALLWVALIAGVLLGGTIER